MSISRETVKFVMPALFDAAVPYAYDDTEMPTVRANRTEFIQRMVDQYIAGPKPGWWSDQSYEISGRGVRVQPRLLSLPPVSDPMMEITED